jgi:hypothetical protein
MTNFYLRLQHHPKTQPEITTPSKNTTKSPGAVTSGLFVQPPRSPEVPAVVPGHAGPGVPDVRVAGSTRSATLEAARCSCIVAAAPLQHSPLQENISSNTNTALLLSKAAKCKRPRSPHPTKRYHTEQRSCDLPGHRASSPLATRAHSEQTTVY